MIARFMLALYLLPISFGPARAHYQILLIDPPAAKRGEAVTITYCWGHPYEHQLFDTPTPESFSITGPNGRKQTARLQPYKESGLEGKSLTAFRCRFTPEERGDYILSLQAPPIWMEEDREFLHDSVTTVLHVQKQDGWGRSPPGDFELAPLTRPYGIEPGMAFQVQVLFKKRPQIGAMVELELYHASPPPSLPPDEMMTRSVKSDAAGSAIVTPTAPGWWAVTGIRDAGMRDHNGKAFPIKQRATLWISVDPPPAR